MVEKWLRMTRHPVTLWVKPKDCKKWIGQVLGVSSQIQSCQFSHTPSSNCQWIEDQDLQVTTVTPLLFCPSSLRKRHYHCRWDSGPWDVTSKLPKLPFSSCFAMDHPCKVANLCCRQKDGGPSQSKHSGSDARCCDRSQGLQGTFAPTKTQTQVTSTIMNTPNMFDVSAAKEKFRVAACS